MKPARASARRPPEPAVDVQPASRPREGGDLRIRIADVLERAGYAAAGLLARQDPTHPDAFAAVAKDVVGAALQAPEVVVEGGASPELLTVYVYAVRALVLGRPVEEVSLALDVMDRRRCGRCALEALFDLQASCPRCETSRDTTTQESLAFAGIVARRVRGGDALVKTKRACGAWRAWVEDTTSRPGVRTRRCATEGEAAEALTAALARELFSGGTGR